MQNDCSQRAIPATRRTSQHAGHAPAAPLHSADPVVASLREHVKGTEKRLRYHYLWRGITHAAGDKTCTCIFRNYCPSFAHVRRGFQKHFRHERQCKHGGYGHHALSGGHPGHAAKLLECAHQPFRHAPGAGREPRERVRQTQQRHSGPDQKKERRVSGHLGRIPSAGRSQSQRDAGQNQRHLRPDGHGAQRADPTGPRRRL